MVISLGLQRRVEGLLQEHLDRLQLNSGKFTGNRGDSEHMGQVENANLDENADSFLDGSVMEKVLQRRSLRMRNMQRAWQVGYIWLSSLPCVSNAHLLGQHILINYLQYHAKGFGLFSNVSFFI